jgi:hypothetical protein
MGLKKLLQIREYKANPVRSSGHHRFSCQISFGGCQESGGNFKTIFADPFMP